MSPAIQLLLIQIMQLSTLLVTDSRYQVHAKISDHCYQLSVVLYPAGSIWRLGFPTPQPIATAEVRWEPYCSVLDSDDDYAAALHQTKRQLEFMRAALHGYLPVEPSELEAAA